MSSKLKFQYHPGGSIVTCWILIGTRPGLFIYLLTYLLLAIKLTFKNKLSLRNTHWSKKYVSLPQSHYQNY